MTGVFRLLCTMLMALSCMTVFGCVSDWEDPVVESPGVVQSEKSYWAGDVFVTQRETVIRSYDTVTHYFRGSVKNLGSSAVQNARFEIVSYDLVYERNGNVERQDEEIGATQSFGTLAAQQELPINLSYSHPSTASREIVGRFSGD